MCILICKYVMERTIKIEVTPDIDPTLLETFEHRSSEKLVTRCRAQFGDDDEMGSDNSRGEGSIKSGPHTSPCLPAGTPSANQATGSFEFVPVPVEDIKQEDMHWTDQDEAGVGDTAGPSGWHGEHSGMDKLSLTQASYDTSTLPWKASQGRYRRRALNAMLSGKQSKEGLAHIQIESLKKHHALKMEALKIEHKFRMDTLQFNINVKMKKLEDGFKYGH